MSPPCGGHGPSPQQSPQGQAPPTCRPPWDTCKYKAPQDFPAFEASNPHHLSVCPQGPSRRGTIGTPWRPLFRWVGLRPVGRPGKSPLIPPSQPAGSPRGQDRTNYLPNCMVLKAPRHPRAPFLRRAAVCMTDPPTHPLPSPPLQKKERKKKDTHTHKPPHIYIYIYLLTKKQKQKQKTIISKFARTFYHNMCLALPRTSINF